MRNINTLLQNGYGVGSQPIRTLHAELQTSFQFVAAVTRASATSAIRIRSASAAQSAMHERIQQARASRGKDK